MLRGRNTVVISSPPDFLWKQTGDVILLEELFERLPSSLDFRKVLTFAIEKEWEESVLCCKEKGVPFNTTTRGIEWTLHTAARTSARMIRLVVQCGADVKLMFTYFGNPIYEAANEETVEALLELGVPCPPYRSIEGFEFHWRYKDVLDRFNKKRKRYMNLRYGLPPNH